MSIVQAALDRMKAAREQGAPREQAAPRPAAPPPAVVTPVPLEWPRRGLTEVKINLPDLAERGLYSDPAVARRQQDEFRRLRRDVLGAMRSHNDQGEGVSSPVVLVTSPMPGDGKSWTALNLALSTAAVEGPDVLLIDADPYKCSITNALGLGDAPGLLDLLRNPTTEFMNLAQPTSVRRLHVIPAGHNNGEVGDLFTAERLRLVVGSIARTMAGHVAIIDSVPILISSETAALADVSGQVLMVVRAGVTLRESVTEAVSRVRTSVPVGLVLNGWRPMLNAQSDHYYAYENYRK